MYMTETPINTACFDMEMNSIRWFRTLRKFHCTALTCPVVYGIAAIVFAMCLYLQNPVRQSTVRLSTVFIQWERHQGDTASLNLIFWINQNCEIIKLIIFNRSEKDIYDTFDTVSSNQSVSFKARRWILIKFPRCDGINLCSWIQRTKGLGQDQSYCK